MDKEDVEELIALLEEKMFFMRPDDDMCEDCHTVFVNPRDGSYLWNVCYCRRDD